MPAVFLIPIIFPEYIKSTGKYRREDYGKVTEEGIKILVIYSVCVYIEGKRGEDIYEKYGKEGK